MPEVKRQLSEKEKPGQATHKIKTAIPARVESKLLRYVSRDLRLRYQRMIDDISYWEKLQVSYFLNQYVKQFSDVKNKVDRNIEFNGDEAEEVQEKKAGVSFSYNKKLVEMLEVRVSDGFEREKLSEVQVFYKKLADRLLVTDSLDRTGVQTSWWTYFRIALEQRMVPQYHHFLEKVDIIARDCYYPLLKAAEDLTGKKLGKHLAWQSPPMVVLKSGEFYRALSSRYAPISFIFVPFDRMDNVWNLCAIHHEVGHDFFHKLNSLKEVDEPAVALHFRSNVKAQMEGPDLSEEELSVSQFLGSETYLGWLEEIFADMMGIMLAGPTYSSSLQEILFDDNITAFVSHDYPSTYMRILINLIFAGGQLGYLEESLALLEEWFSTFANSNNEPVGGELSIKAQEALMQRWLGQVAASEQLANSAFEALLKATHDLVEQMNAQKKELQNIKEKAFRAFKPSTVNELTVAGVLGWLIKLIDACWQAELVPNTGINLQKIYKEMKPPDNEGIKQAAGKLKEMNRVDCRPRYLVPAVRQAFEALMLRGKADFEGELRQIFLDSLNERPEVANEFKRLGAQVDVAPLPVGPPDDEEAPEKDEGVTWDAIRDYNATLPIYSQEVLPRSKSDMPMQQLR